VRGNPIGVVQASKYAKPAWRKAALTNGSENRLLLMLNRQTVVGSGTAYVPSSEQETRDHNCIKCVEFFANPQEQNENIFHASPH